MKVLDLSIGKNRIKREDIKENFFPTVISASSKSLNFKKHQILFPIIKKGYVCNRN